MTKNEASPFSRRQIVGAVGVSLAAAGPAFAQQPSSPTFKGKAMQDPTTKYPQPPFKKQSQPWPGLASEMDPKPDHGEASYRGSGRLAGRKALITGGDSGMGRAAAIAFAREGADVAINYLPDEEPDAREVIDLIKKEGRVGLAIPGDLREEAFLPKARRGSRARTGWIGHRRQQRRATAVERIDRRHYDRAIRLDHEDKHLCAVLDHQGGVASLATGVLDHRHGLRAGL